MTKEGMHFIQEISEAYEAYRERPMLHRQIADLEAVNRRDGETISRLELKLMDRANEIAELNAKIARLEVERDDASFRELVADDKATAAVAALRNVFSSVGEALKALQPEPVQAQPEIKAEPHPEGQDQREPDPTVAGETTTALTTESVSANSEPVTEQESVASTDSEYSYWPIANRASQYSF